MNTIKIPIKPFSSEEYDKFQRQFSSTVRLCYNRILDGLNQKEVENYIKSMNNLEMIDSYWRRMAYEKANDKFKALKALNVENKNIVFGTKKALNNRYKNIITNEQFKQKRLTAIYTIGEANQYGNRKVSLDLPNNQITLKINKSTHITFDLLNTSKNNKFILEQLYNLSKNNEIPLTYNFTKTHICITYDEKYITTDFYYKPKENRILSMDMNPESIGITICDYKNHNQKILYKEIVSIQDLVNYDTNGLSSDDKENIYKNNKLKFETLEIRKHIISLVKRFNVETICCENLVIKNKKKDKTKSKKQKFATKKSNKKNKNLWKRNIFSNNLEKWCKIYKINFRKVPPEYSSLIGCINHPTEIDSIAAAIEINRRCYTFTSMYIKQTQKVTKNVIYPVIENKDVVLNRWKKDGMTIKSLSSWKKLYDWFILNPKSSYRLTLNDVKNHLKCSRLNSCKIKLYVL